MPASRNLIMCNDQIQALPRLRDGDGLFLHCAGGFRAAMVDDDKWMIMPVLDDTRPCAKGYLTKTAVQSFIEEIGLRAIALQHSGWVGGEYRAAWSPIFAGQRNQIEGPAELWSNVASNLAQKRSYEAIQKIEKPTMEKIGSILDDQSEEERLARSISLSIRSMDICVEHIAEFYNEQLTDFMAAGRLNGSKSSAATEQILYADVHSFFTHFGAARDYLASLIAVRLGEKADAMNRLLEILRPKHAGKDPLLDILIAKGYVQLEPAAGSRRDMAGWLKEASVLRNQFVHRRPYGYKFAEGFGELRPISSALGLYQYIRPVVSDEGLKQDILDVVAYHYSRALSLFHQAAEVSGLDTSMLTLKAKDIISVKWHRGGQKPDRTDASGRV